MAQYKIKKKQKIQPWWLAKIVAQALKPVINALYRAKQN